MMSIKRAEAARLEEQRVQELQARRRERLAEAERRKATMEVLRAQEAQGERRKTERIIDKLRRVSL